MTDNVGYTPGSGEIVATDDIGGVQFQRVKVTLGADGISDGDVSGSNPMPVLPATSDDLLRMLSRVVKLLESNAVVDSAQRQRVVLDAIAAGLTLGTVTTCSTVTSVSNVAANAGMDREQYINVAKQAYAMSIRNQLSFV